MTAVAAEADDVLLGLIAEPVFRCWFYGCEGPRHRHDESSLWGSLGDVPGAIRLRLVEHLAAWHRGEASTCRHHPRAASAASALAAAWLPTRVTCSRAECQTTLYRPGTIQLICDHCDRVDFRGLSPMWIRLPSFFWAIMLCDDCLPTPESS